MVEGHNASVALEILIIVNCVVTLFDVLVGAPIPTKMSVATEHWRDVIVCPGYNLGDVEGSVLHVM